MASLDSLLGILNEIYHLYMEMIDLAKQKKQILINGKIDELSKLINLESNWVKKIGKLEEKRVHSIQAYLEESQYQTNEITMTELIDSIKSSAEKEQLIEVNKKLQASIEEIKQLNDLNTQLIEHSLDYISTSLEHITGPKTQSYTYSKPEAKTANITSSNGFFDKKA